MSDGLTTFLLPPSSFRLPRLVSLIVLGGMRDRVGASVNYRLSLREYVSLEAWAARYYTQDDTYLGQGRGFT